MVLKAVATLLISLMVLTGGVRIATRLLMPANFVNLGGRCRDASGSKWPDIFKSGSLWTADSCASVCNALVECDAIEIRDSGTCYIHGVVQSETPSGWSFASGSGGGEIVQGDTYPTSNCWKRTTPAPATPIPTPSPTPAPQATPPAAGGAGAGASAVGDPHLQNVHGERFDLMKPGKHVLINIPRGERAESALLHVQADASQLGGQCADMYFQELNVTGYWAEAKQVGGYHYSVYQRDVFTPEWIAFGKVGLKVVHGRTDSGLSYLNFYVKHLGQAGFAVGGLLGEDDHEDVITPPEACVKSLSLIDGEEGGHHAPSVLSFAEASLA